MFRGDGRQHCVIFSRQSGKDELLAQLQAFLLARYRIAGGDIVIASPTFKPQSLVSRRRLVERVSTPLHPGAHPSGGYRVVVGRAASTFLSAEPTANVRGETASLLLGANEAQDIDTAVFDSRFAPMTASTNAPVVFSGTPWSDTSLLARQRADAREQGTLYEADWEVVAAVVPKYGDHVRRRMKQLGENHPFILTEYKLKELGTEGGLFPAARRALMRGDHERIRVPIPGRVYALLVDVAGADETPADGPLSSGGGPHLDRDATAVSIVEVDMATVRDPLINRPTYRAVDRLEWVGERQTEQYAKLVALAELWRPRYCVIDATGIGAGLASFLTQRLHKPGRRDVIPFIFTSKSKSDLAWTFIGMVESGRYKEYQPDGHDDTGEFWHQVEACEYTVLDGPGKLMRYGVPTTKGHDDLLISAMLSGVLDEQDWTPRRFITQQRNDYA